MKEGVAQFAEARDVYHSAVLSRLVRKVVTIEIRQRLFERAAALLAYFNIPNANGDRLEALCRDKQRMIAHLIDEGKFTAYDDALGFAVKAKCAGALLGAASSSKNANKLISKVELHEFCRRSGLECCFVRPQTTLLDIFDANVCGRELARGKPHPEIFLSAAEMLGREPGACVVIEDAPSGVQAAKSGGMLCIGVARLDDQDLLRSAGADWVVSSLNGIDPVALLRSPPR